MKKIFYCTIPLLFLLLFSGCSSTKEKFTVHLIEDEMFDTVIQFIQYTEDEEEFEKNTEIIKNEFSYYHRLFDKYKDYPGVANIKTINDAAGKAPVTVEQPVIDLLLFAKEMHEKTEGKNNIALGAVLKVWHNYRDMYGDPEEYNEDNTDSKIPDLNELEALRAHTDLSKLIIDDQSNSVFIEDPLMSIDVGGVAKGYATELVAKKLEEAGVTDFAINAGGNVRVSGHSYGSDGKMRSWNTGIQDPFVSTNPSVANIHITSGSLVSSGNYQRYYWHDGKKYSHIIDNDTLYPAFLYAQVSIYHKDSGTADYLSTELFLLPVDEGRKLAEKFDAEVLWMEMDGTIHKTSDFFEMKTP